MRMKFLEFAFDFKVSSYVHGVCHRSHLKKSSVAARFSKGDATANANIDPDPRDAIYISIFIHTYIHTSIYKDTVRI